MIHRFLRDRGCAAARVFLIIGIGGFIAGFIDTGVGYSQEYVPQTDARFPKIRFADGQESLNDRCPVRLGKLNTRMDPLYVNGRPVGFC